MLRRDPLNCDFCCSLRAARGTLALPGEEALFFGWGERTRDPSSLR